MTKQRIGSERQRKERNYPIVLDARILSTTYADRFFSVSSLPKVFSWYETYRLFTSFNAAYQDRAQSQGVRT